MDEIALWIHGAFWCSIGFIINSVFDNIAEKTKRDEKGKPVIRHCRNCEWSDNCIGDSVYCNVKYQYCGKKRLKALFCKYFKGKGVD